MSKFWPKQNGWMAAMILVSLSWAPHGSAAPAAGTANGGVAKKIPEVKEQPKVEAVKPKEEKPVQPQQPQQPQKPLETDEDGEKVAVAKPVTGDPVQIYGWREMVLVEDIKEPLRAKLDTGALTSSVHAEEKELFERDGKKWVRFIMTDPTVEKPVRRKIEAPLVRTALIKEPGGEPVSREVVRLSFQIGERKMRGEFSLNNRSNMLAPVLIGRTIIKDLGLVDASRTNLANEKVFR